MVHKIAIFSSGSKNGGGSGFEKLVENQRNKKLDAEIVVVVSNWPEGGVKQRATRLGIAFEHMVSYRAEDYENILRKYEVDFVCLSGWLKLVPILNASKNTNGLNPSKTINIHPAPLPRFGGAGMYGKHVHEAVYNAFLRGEVTETGPTMHFVTDEYDKGPLIFYKGFKIKSDDNPETIGLKVQEIEHEYQSYVTNLVVNGKISWDGISDSVVFPDDYHFRPT